MKITFPHLGDAHRFVGLLMKEIGIEIVVPPLNSRINLEQGIAVSPEEICLPFKLMIGNLLQAWEMGADTAVMPATMGPCRLGEFAELFNSILLKCGCNYEWIVLDSPQAIGLTETLSRLSKVVRERNVPMVSVLVKLNRVKRLVYDLDKLDSKVRWLVGYVEQPSTCKYALRRCRTELSSAQTIKEAQKVIRQCSKELDELPLRNAEPIKLILTGEIYSLIEPFANHHIEEILMDLGVSVRKRVTIGWWINHTFSEAIQFGKEKNQNPYLTNNVGGYAKETIAESFDSIAEGFDGVIQILPIGCMPEIVAKSVLGRMSTDMNLKTLTIIFDEMDGEAGYVTRIEAFVDMLERRKNGLFFGS